MPAPLTRLGSRAELAAWFAQRSATLFFAPDLGGYVEGATIAARLQDGGADERICRVIRERFLAGPGGSGLLTRALDPGSRA